MKSAQSGHMRIPMICQEDKLTKSKKKLLKCKLIFIK